MLVPLIWPFPVIIAAQAIIVAILLRPALLARKEVYKHGMYWTIT